MPNRALNQGGGLVKADKLRQLRWAHWCAPILVTIVGICGLFLPRPSPAEQTPSLPMFGNVTLSTGFTPDPLVLRGVSGGSTPASIIANRQETLNGPCVGFVDEPPDHRVVLTSFFGYLSLQVYSSSDTTIVIRGPGGSWCNDDERGKNPGISGQWLQGTYEIWVGSYQQEQYHPYRIEITSVNTDPVRR